MFCGIEGPSNQCAPWQPCGTWGAPHQLGDAKASGNKGQEQGTPKERLGCPPLQPHSIGRLLCEPGDSQTTKGSMPVRAGALLSGTEDCVCSGHWAALKLAVATKWSGEGAGVRLVVTPQPLASGTSRCPAGTGGGAIPCCGQEGCETRKGHRPPGDKGTRCNRVKRQGPVSPSSGRPKGRAHSFGKAPNPPWSLPMVKDRLGCH